MEMRISGTIICKLINELFRDDKLTAAARQSAIQQIEHLINRSLSNGSIITKNTVDQNAQLSDEEKYVNDTSNSYRLPGGHAAVVSGQVTKLDLTDVRLRIVCKDITTIIDMIFPDPKTPLDIDRKTNYQLLFRIWDRIVSILRNPNDFSDEDITQYQLLADEFTALYIKMFGTEKITNYIHMLHSGHVAEFLEVYRNIARFATISVESTVGQVRCFVHRRTNKNGHSGKAGVNPRKNINDSVLRWMLRNAGHKFALARKGANMQGNYWDGPLSDGRAIVNRERRDKRVAKSASSNSTNGIVSSNGIEEEEDDDADADADDDDVSDSSSLDNNEMFDDNEFENSYNFESTDDDDE
jgi:hypothetical protein